MSETILVTGGGGFVGSAVVRHLARRLGTEPLLLGGRRPAYRVVALVRPGKDPVRLADLGRGPSWSVREVDLQSPGEVAAVFQDLRPAAVVHAALDGAVHEEDAPDARERRVGRPLRTLVRELGRHGGRRIVHTGSAWVLPGGHGLDEEAPTVPASPYARAKHLEDRLLPELAVDAGVEWINLRLFNLFGRYEDPDRLIPYLVRRLAAGKPAELSTADNVRDFTDVDAVAEAFALALEAPTAATDRVYHVGSGRGARIGEIAELVASVIGRASLLRFGRRETPDAGIRVQVASIGRAREALGWDPPDDLHERVRSVVGWWLKRSPVLTEHGDTA